MEEIKVIPNKELDLIFPMLVILNEGVDEGKIQERLDKIKTFDNYFCIGIYCDDILAGCCGVWELHKIYAGPHLEVDNVCVLPEFRGRSLGEKMMEWVADFAEKNGFNSIELNAYIVNERGVAFWEKVGAIKKGYHMVKFCQGDGWVL